MATETKSETRSGKWKKILVHEFTEYLFNFVYLSFFLVSFAWYRRLILAEYDIINIGYVVPLIEAAILAKVIMIGDAMRMGRRFRNRPLVIPVIYRTVVFGLLVILFAVLEHVIGALLHGKTASAGIVEIKSQGWYEMAAKCLLMLIAFVPFFIMKEIEGAFGPEKVRGMFFGRHREEAECSIGSEKETEKPTPQN